jgi:large subunit ribosomal protein L3
MPEGWCGDPSARIFGLVPDEQTPAPRGGLLDEGWLGGYSRGPFEGWLLSPFGPSPFVEVSAVMNQFPGVVGRKVGMTQIFTEDGSVLPCTVVEARPLVVAKRTKEKDGYDALVLGLGERKEKHVNRPLGGFYKSKGVKPAARLRELRCDAEFAAQFEVGEVLGLDKVFEAGQKVDVCGVTRGRGFTGVMRRHNFKGAKRSHGAHEYQRHGGAIGTNMTPGRTLPGLKMPGQYGNERVTVLSQPVVKVLAEQGLLLIHGAVPGAKNGLVVVRGAVKSLGGKAKA